MSEPAEASPTTQTLRTLVVVFRDRLTLGMLETAPPESLRIGDLTYVDGSLGDWRGFYDWLRDKSAGILGVRFWPFHAARSLCESASGRSYVEVDPQRKYLDIYFSSARSVDPHRSADQDFGNNRVMSAGGKASAITFDLDGLDPVELQAIKHADADWFTAV